MGPGEYATQSGLFNGPVSQNLHARTPASGLLTFK